MKVLTERYINTPRLKTFILSGGSETGIPLLLLHGNTASSYYFHKFISSLPNDYYAFAPDLRGFGRADPLPVDATRGLKDFSDDIHSILDEMKIDKVNILGWSLGGGIGMQFMLDHTDRVASLILESPVCPYGYLGIKSDGTPVYPDYAGAGVNPRYLTLAEQIQRKNPILKEFVRDIYSKDAYQLSEDELELFTREFLLTVVGDGNFPGDYKESPNWPGWQPGTQGWLNSVSPKYFNTTAIVDLAIKPPILWIHGLKDRIISNSAQTDPAVLGSIGRLPEYPGEEVYPPQPQVDQIQVILNEYSSKGGRVATHFFEECGHAPHIESLNEFTSVVCEFLSSIK